MLFPIGLVDIGATGPAPFWGGLRLRYPPQKFSAFLTMLSKIKIGQVISLNQAEQHKLTDEVDIF